MAAAARSVSAPVATQKTRMRSGDRPCEPRCWPGIALSFLGLFVNVLRQSRDAARREQLAFTSLAAQAMKDEQFDRATRFALQGYPAQGAMDAIFN
jgi:hypothetical protein